MLQLFRLGPSMRTMLDRQTLRVCNEIVWGPFEHPCRVACRLAKRCVCAASAFPAVEISDDSSFRAHRRPPNVTHVTVYVFSVHLFSSPCVLRPPNMRGRKVW